MSVVCVGEALIVLVQGEPGPLEDAVTFRRSIGGAEINTAVALAAAGVETAVVTRVGDDGFGRYVSGTLENLGVRTHAIIIDTERRTGLYIKEVGGSTSQPTDLGERASRMHYYREGSAGSALSPATLRASDVAQTLAEASVLHTTGITAALSPSASAAVTALFNERSSDQLASFDVNWRPALWRGREAHGAEILGSLVSKSDIVLVGRNEAVAVFGTGEPADLRALFPQPRWLIVKDDERPAVGFDGGTRIEVAAPPVDVVETIGAGDAFAAGLIAALADGKPLERAMQAAHLMAGRALASSSDHVGPSR
jgi:2-dehydro-3-deoxygluconokinase